MEYKTLRENFILVENIYKSKMRYKKFGKNYILEKISELKKERRTLRENFILKEKISKSKIRISKTFKEQYMLGKKISKLKMWFAKIVREYFIPVKANRGKKVQTVQAKVWLLNVVQIGVQKNIRKIPQYPPAAFFLTRQRSYPLSDRPGHFFSNRFLTQSASGHSTVL